VRRQLRLSAIETGPDAYLTKADLAIALGHDVDICYASLQEAMMAEPTCLMCRFFVFEGDPEGSPVKGKCHRYPPSQYAPQPNGWEDVHPGEPWDPAWKSPTVRSDYWCGEHQPKPPSTDKEEEKAIVGAGFTMADDEDGNERS
jgi:hypothetical protein